MTSIVEGGEVEVAPQRDMIKRDERIKNDIIKMTYENQMTKIDKRIMRK